MVKDIYISQNIPQGSGPVPPGPGPDPQDNYHFLWTGYGSTPLQLLASSLGDVYIIPVTSLFNDSNCEFSISEKYFPGNLTASIVSNNLKINLLENSSDHEYTGYVTLVQSGSNKTLTLNISQINESTIPSLRIINEGIFFPEYDPETKEINLLLGDSYVETLAMSDISSGKIGLCYRYDTEQEFLDDRYINTFNDRTVSVLSNVRYTIPFEIDETIVFNDSIYIKLVDLANPPATLYSVDGSIIKVKVKNFTTSGGGGGGYSEYDPGTGTGGGTPGKDDEQIDP